MTQAPASPGDEHRSSGDLAPGPGLTAYQRFGKRGVDLLGCLLLLPVALPVMLVVALAVLGVLGRPLLFRQWRSGRGGQPFRVLKFRSMAMGSAADSARLGRFGLLLRASGLDELPQLLQVLAGQMSLVGPRPLPCSYDALYTPRQALRQQMRPGLCGLAQAAGRNATPWPLRLELDARYAETLSMRGDLVLIGHCLWLLLRGIGAHAPGHATMPALHAALHPALHVEHGAATGPDLLPLPEAPR